VHEPGDREATVRERLPGEGKPRPACVILSERRIPCFGAPGEILRRYTPQNDTAERAPGEILRRCAPQNDTDSHSRKVMLDGIARGGAA
jgi:hypothetical protein